MPYEITVEPFTDTVGALWWRRRLVRWRATIQSTFGPQGEPPPIFGGKKFEADTRDHARVKAELWIDEFERQRRIKAEGRITYTYEPAAD